MNDPGCIERSATGFERRARRDHVIEQDRVTPCGGRMRRKRAHYIGDALFTRQPRLVGCVTPAREQRWCELHPHLSTPAAREQRGRIISSLYQAPEMERHGDHDRPRCERRARQQRAESISQVGALTELQPQNRRRERRTVGTAGDGAERQRIGRRRTSTAVRAKDVHAVLEWSVTGGAVVGRDRSHEAARDLPKQASPLCP